VAIFLAAHCENWSTQIQQRCQFHEYLSEPFVPLTSRPSPRSASSNQLDVSSVKQSSYAARAFSCYGPAVQNSLPPEYLRDSLQSLDVLGDILRHSCCWLLIFLQRCNEIGSMWLLHSTSYYYYHYYHYYYYYFLHYYWSTQPHTNASQTQNRKRRKVWQIGTRRLTASRVRSSPRWTSSSRPRSNFSYETVASVGLNIELRPRPTNSEPSTSATFACLAMSIAWSCNNTNASHSQKRSQSIDQSIILIVSEETKTTARSTKVLTTVQAQRGSEQSSLWRSRV